MGNSSSLTSPSEKAVVLLSGGQDSTTALFWAKQNFKEVHAVSFFYGQRHSIEIESAKIIAKMADVQYLMLRAEVFNQLHDSALLNKSSSISEQHRVGGLPSSFVPGRNVIFFTLATMYAYKFNTYNLVAGVCQTDYSGYYDCRKSAVDAIEKALIESLGYGGLRIHTPLMFLTKAETVFLASILEGCMEALAYSHTCYEGVYPPCGKCPACILRAKGFKEAGIKDPLIERFEKGE